MRTKLLSRRVIRTAKRLYANRAGSVIVLRQRDVAEALRLVEGQDCRNHLTGDQPVAAGQLVDDIEPARDRIRRVDNDGRHRNAPCDLKKLVPVWFMITVESPDAAQPRRPASR